MKFLIAAPPYSHQSGGIMVLHLLCDALCKAGHEAAIVFFHGGVAPNFQWAISNQVELYGPNFMRVQLPMDDGNAMALNFLKDGITIYPDLIVGNPLSARHVVRYLLYKNEQYDGSADNEFVLSYSKIYHSCPNAYLFRVFTDSNLHANGSMHWTKRTLDCTYFGKGPNFTNCSVIPNTVLISRNWPEDKRQLGVLLRQCRYFYTWDGASATNTDALICGAIPVLMHDLQLSNQDYLGYELGPMPNINVKKIEGSVDVQVDPLQVDQEVLKILERIKFYETSWQQTVNDFSEKAADFFKLSYK
jgi:hypothetical protein